MDEQAHAAADHALLYRSPVCPVCREYLVSAAAPPRVACPVGCGHLFHKDCLQTWERSCAGKGKNEFTCPSCRIVSKKAAPVQLSLEPFEGSLSLSQAEAKHQQVVAELKGAHGRELSAAENRIKDMEAAKSALEKKMSALQLKVHQLADQARRQEKVIETVSEQNRELKQKQQIWDSLKADCSVPQPELQRILHNVVNVDELRAVFTEVFSDFQAAKKVIKEKDEKIAELAATIGNLQRVQILERQAARAPENVYPGALKRLRTEQSSRPASAEVASGDSKGVRSKRLVRQQLL